MEKYPKIAVLSENLRGRTFEISKAEMSIGSHKDNDICIDDSSVSDHHADIFLREVDGKTVYVLRDNNSLNGTRVNNVMTTGEQVLKYSDIVQFGDIEVLFDINESNKSQVDDIRSIDLPIAGVFVRYFDFDSSPRRKRNFLGFVKNLLKRHK